MLFKQFTVVVIDYINTISWFIFFQIIFKWLTMRTIELITFNCFICLILVIVSTDSQLFSVLALATLAKVLRPRPKYRPPPMYPYDPMVSSSSHGAPIMMRPSPPPSPLTPQQFPMVQQSFSQPIPPISSKSGFGYPSNQLVSTNQGKFYFFKINQLNCNRIYYLLLFTNINLQQ